MRKNEIYIAMINLALPYIRNVQTHSKLRKAMDKSCYYEAELIHNLTHSILNEHFETHDIHFLNNQAKYYFDNCNENISINYNTHIFYIKKLFSMVPDEFKKDLLWSGPIDKM